jgi:hypothetical protein
MTPLTVTTVLAALALLRFMTVTHQRASYVCPVCGTKRQDRHAHECPWKR